MPYIKNEKRNDILNDLRNLQVHIKEKGDLNYAICELVGNLIISDKKLSYTTISEWIDAVHDAEEELRRRILNIYEDKKIVENDDVPSFIKILEKMNGK